jgi:hypothetical protein
LGWALILITIGLCIYSRLKNLKAIYLAIIILQIRCLFFLFQQEDILEAENPAQLSVFTVFLSIVCMMNILLISHLYAQYKLLINGITIALLDLALLQRFYGYDDFG